MFTNSKQAGSIRKDPKPRSKSGRRSNFMILLPVLALLVLGRATAVDSSEITGRTLIDQLLAGGFNIYFRHVSTDWSQADRVSRAGDWLSCDPERMRQLSDSGRADARAIGRAMRELGIPVGEVLASPYCRTVETARLMNLGQVTPSNEVMNLRSGDYFGGRAAIVGKAQTLLATPPAPGTNRVIVAHGNVAREATPVYPGEGEGIVFQPDGNGGFRVITRIPPDRWAQLLTSYTN